MPRFMKPSSVRQRLVDQNFDNKPTVGNNFNFPHANQWISARHSSKKVWPHVHRGR